MIAAQADSRPHGGIRNAALAKQNAPQFPAGRLLSIEGGY